jgi:hypothetical protein
VVSSLVGLGRMRRMTAAQLVVSAVVAAGLAGCGAAETPKAPKTAVQSTVGKLGLYCGEATRLLAGDRDRATLRALDSRAAGPAKQLIAIARRDPKAVYLSSSMAQLVGTWATTASSCELQATAKRLRAAHGRLG